MDNNNAKSPNPEVQTIIGEVQKENSEEATSTSSKDKSEVVTDDKKKKSEGWLTDTRKAFITLLATPLTVAVTIYFTNWIKAPKPEIQFISWFKYYNNIPPSNKIKEEISSNNLLSSLLRQSLDKSNSISSLNWLNGVGGWNYDNQEAFIKASFEVEGILQSMLLDNRARQSGKLGEILPVLKEQIVQNETALNTIQRFRKELQDNVKKSNSYTGAIDFTIGILNKGDADGVVYDEATLKFKGKEMKIYADNFTSVKAHSFEKMTFPAPLYFNNVFESRYLEKDTNTIKEWTSLIKNKDVVPYEIEIIFNGKGESYKGTVDH